MFSSACKLTLLFFASLLMAGTPPLTDAERFALAGHNEMVKCWNAWLQARNETDAAALEFKGMVDLPRWHPPIVEAVEGKVKAERAAWERVYRSAGWLSRSKAKGK